LKGRQKLAETVSKKKESGYGILGQGNEQTLPKMELSSVREIDFIVASSRLRDSYMPS
jgi:hypothetical protein